MSTVYDLLLGHYTIPLMYFILSTLKYIIHICFAQLPSFEMF